MTDRYTRFVLTVIALALCVIALKGVFTPIAPAWATDTTQCQITDFRDTLTVEIAGSSSKPGSSSGYPIYVKMVD